MHELLCGNEFDFEDNRVTRKTHFHKETVDQDRFATEGKGNTEIAYWAQTRLSLLCNNHVYVPYLLCFYCRLYVLKLSVCSFVCSTCLLACSSLWAKVGGLGDVCEASLWGGGYF